MQYGVHLGCWGEEYNAEQLPLHLVQAAQIGARTFETRVPDSALAFNLPFCQSIRQAQRETGVQAIYTLRFPAGYEMSSPDQETRERAQYFLKKSIHAVAMSGGNILEGIVYAHWPADYTAETLNPQIKHDRLSRSIESIREVMPVAEAEGVNIHLEIVNRFEHYLINTVEEGLYFCSCVQSSRCKLLADVFHMNIEEDDIPAAIRCAGEMLGHLHVSEPNRKIPHHTARIHWPAIGDALREMNYQGTVTIESFLQFRGEATQNLRIWRDLTPDVSFPARMRQLEQGLRYIRSQFEATS